MLRTVIYKLFLFDLTICFYKGSCIFVRNNLISDVLFLFLKVHERNALILENEEVSLAEVKIYLRPEAYPILKMIVKRKHNDTK